MPELFNSESLRRAKYYPDSTVQPKTAMEVRMIGQPFREDITQCLVKFNDGAEKQVPCRIDGMMGSLATYLDEKGKPFQVQVLKFVVNSRQVCRILLEDGRVLTVPANQVEMEGVDNQGIAA